MDHMRISGNEYTQRHFAVDRIYFNQEYFDKCLNKATEFL